MKFWKVEKPSSVLATHVLGKTNATCIRVRWIKEIKKIARRDELNFSWINRLVSSDEICAAKQISLNLTTNLLNLLFSRAWKMNNSQIIVKLNKLLNNLK